MINKLTILFLFSLTFNLAAEKAYISDLDLSKVKQAVWNAQKDKSVTSQPLKIAGQSFAKGIGTQADPTILIDLKGKATKFSAHVGIDDYKVDTTGATYNAYGESGMKAFYRTANAKKQYLGLATAGKVKGVRPSSVFLPMIKKSGRVRPLKAVIRR